MRDMCRGGSNVWVVCGGCGRVKGSWAWVVGGGCSRAGVLSGGSSSMSKCRGRCNVGDMSRGGRG